MQSCVDFSNGFSGDPSEQKSAACCPPENRPFSWRAPLWNGGCEPPEPRKKVEVHPSVRYRDFVSPPPWPSVPRTRLSVSTMCVRLT